MKKICKKIYKKIIKNGFMKWLKNVTFKFKLGHDFYNS